MKKNNIDNIIKSLSNLSLKEILSLTTKLAKKFKINNIDNISTNNNNIQNKDEIKKKKNVNIILQSSGNSSKLSLIRTLREVTNIGLKEAKELTDKIPCIILNNIVYDKYKEIEKKFDKIGAKIKIE
ncbi:ribosomal protein bL12 [Candidatus Vidania fulgoroideorum]